MAQAALKRWKSSSIPESKRDLRTGWRNCQTTRLGADAIDKSTTTTEIHLPSCPDHCTSSIRLGDAHHQGREVPRGIITCKMHSPVSQLVETGLIHWDHRRPISAIETHMIRQIRIKMAMLFPISDISTQDGVQHDRFWVSFRVGLRQKARITARPHQDHDTKTKQQSAQQPSPRVLGGSSHRRRFRP